MQLLIHPAKYIKEEITAWHLFKTLNLSFPKLFANMRCSQTTIALIAVPVIQAKMGCSF